MDLFVPSLSLSDWIKILCLLGIGAALLLLRWLKRNPPRSGVERKKRPGSLRH